MRRIVRSILFLLLVVVLHMTVSGFSTKENLCETTVMTSLSSIQSCFDSMQLPHLPDAELGSIGFYLHQAGTDRIHRTPWGPAFSLLNVERLMAEREAMLFKHGQKMDDDTFLLASITHPISEYYVFALRHIII